MFGLAEDCFRSGPPGAMTGSSRTTGSTGDSEIDKERWVVVTGFEASFGKDRESVLRTKRRVLTSKPPLSAGPARASQAPGPPRPQDPPRAGAMQASSADPRIVGEATGESMPNVSPRAAVLITHQNGEFWIHGLNKWHYYNEFHLS